jgi:hypothetical protein
VPITRSKKKRRTRSPSLSSYKESSQPTIYNLDGTRSRQAPLSRNLYKSQLILGNVIDNLFLRYSVTMVLFITLTFAADLHSTKEAHRLLNSFMNDIRVRYSKYIWVLQPQRSGRIHYHLLVPVDFDTHQGTDLDPWKNRTRYTDADRLKAMGPQFRGESDWWQEKAPRHNFGRVEVAPIYSNGEAIRDYLTRQDWRTSHWPFEEEKSFHFWSCSRSARAGSVKFSWYTPGGRLCRQRLREWAHQQGCDTYEELPTKLGPHWGYRFHCHLQHLLRSQEESPPMTETAPAGDGSAKEESAACESAGGDLRCQEGHPTRCDHVWLQGQ